jgi:AcrR family transcriptional regulator
MNKPLMPLVQVLGGQAGPESRRLPKRERTRRQLIAAAITTFSARGVQQATIHEIAAAAEMTTATIYNHFRGKDEIVTAVAMSIAGTLRERSAPGQGTFKNGAERLAVGCRRYLRLAEESPAWALLILDLAIVSPDFLKTISSYLLADLRLGERQKVFKTISEASALDLIEGTVMQAMRRIALGQAPPQHARAVTTVILCGLGVPNSRARTIVERPMPLLPTS